MTSSDSFYLAFELRGVSGCLYALRHAVETETITPKAIYDALVGVGDHLDRLVKELED